MGVKKNRRDTSVSVSQDRAEQLRLLAEAYGCSPREVVERWISQSLKELGMGPHGVPYWTPPGVSIRKVVVKGIDFLELTHEALPMTLLRISIQMDDGLGERSEAAELAQAIEEAARVNRPWSYTSTKHGGRTLALRRRGTAVVLIVDDEGEDKDEERKGAPELLLSPTMALELADAIRFLCHPSQKSAALLHLAETPRTSKEIELADAYEVAW